MGACDIRIHITIDIGEERRNLLGQHFQTVPQIVQLIDDDR